MATIKKMKKLSFIVILLIFTSCSNNEKRRTTITNSIEQIETKETNDIDTIQPKEVEMIKSSNTLSFTLKKETEIGVINDLDNFSNLRESRNLNSKVITQIKDKEYFFYNPNPSNWYKVKDLKGNIGFLHKSRISKINDENLIMFSFTNYNTIDKKEFEDQSIISIDSLQNYLDGHPFGFEFLCKEFDLISEKENSVIYSGQEIKIEIAKEKFEPKEHLIEYHPEHKNSTYRIDNEIIWGTDGGIPKFYTSEIRISRSGLDFYIPNKELKNLFNPNLDYTKIYKTKHNQIIIHMSNSDAAGAYSVIFFIKGDELIKRIIYIPF